jgi:hypothetical protein
MIPFLIDCAKLKFEKKQWGLWTAADMGSK